MKYSKTRTWAEVDLGNLEHNYRTLRGCIEPGCRFLGVVKANAYGHGAAAVGRRLEELGAEYLAVARRCLRRSWPGPCRTPPGRRGNGQRSI